MAFTIKRGDSLPPLRQTIREPSRAPVVRANLG